MTVARLLDVDVMHRVWELRRQGLSPEGIAHQVPWSRTRIRAHFAACGGVPPRWGKPSTARFLSLGEREEIALLHGQGVRVREIGRVIGRSASTVSRELTRNAGISGYLPVAAHRLAGQRARRPKPAKLAVNLRLRAEVQARLKIHCSPEQIAGRLAIDFPDDAEMRVSHETIYQSLYLLSRGGLKRDLEAQLRTGRTMRKPRRKSDQRRGQIQDMTLIADRPPEALDRAVPGHWEGDLIAGKANRSFIGTVVERRSGYLMLVRVAGDKDRVDAVRDGLIDKLTTLPSTLRRTLTWDQGKEMHKHAEVAISTDINIYFCDPHSPWQRPTNENTNGLLRQYFPKGTDLSGYSQDYLDAVALEMNNRPRKRLAFHTPNETIGDILLQ